MPDHLEMVVGGRRQTALPVTPDFTSRTSPLEGFFMEGSRLSSFEMPDYWIPFYGVGLQYTRQTAKRFFFQDGRHRELPLENEDCLVIAPQELRQYRFEGAGKFILVSIEPIVMQEIIAGSPGSANPFELTRTANGPNPILEDLVLKLQAEVTAGYRLAPCSANRFAPDSRRS